MPTLNGVANDTALYLTVLETLSNCEVRCVYAVVVPRSLMRYRCSLARLSVGSRPRPLYMSSEFRRLVVSIDTTLHLL